MVLITGGASGLGRGLAQAWIDRGAKVIIADIDDVRCAETASSIGAAQAITLDVSDPSSVTQAIGRVVSEFGRLDLMVNNAGFSVNGEIRHIPTEDWQRIFAVNTLGVVYGSQAAYAHMLEQGGGHIVNIASIFGLVSAPLAAPYVASKHAVVGFTRALQHEAAASGVQVTLVCPGFIDTGFFDNARYAGVDRAQLKRRGDPPTVPLDVAVQKIVDGVARGRREVIFPWSVKLYRWLDRYAPWLLSNLYRRALHDHRALLVEQPQTDSKGDLP
ncbi:MAG: SDR family NAD(P)-dependent oxidoreductase [Bradymonadia bacterium]